jgi:DNA repair exonuclease SbcCD ATPase subunit
VATAYDDAVLALYRAPLDEFVAERKRLSSELKASGDKHGAARLAKLARPPISAWTVNQLFREARETFDELFAAGERLRAGDLGATSAHREAMTKLRARAETLLGAAGHAASEATLRRITTDLSALAVMGSFDPDPPGALAGDREPPGFDALGMVAPEVVRPAAEHRHSKIDRTEIADAKRKETNAAHERQEQERQERERRKAEAERERRKAEEERAKKRAERERLAAALRSAKVELQTRTKELARLRSELAKAEKTVAQAQAVIDDLESRLTGLE